MGITIRIGDAEVRYEPSERRAWYDVPIIRHKNAPGDGTNQWCTSYGGRYNLHTTTGLEPMMKGATYRDEAGKWRDCLLSAHPGCFELTPWHLERFKEIREAYRLKPRSEKGLCIDEEGRDWGAEHLDWICYWTAWALDNCALPSIYNR